MLETMRYLLKIVQPAGTDIKPHVWHLDARFSSFPFLRNLQDRHHYCIMSFAANRKVVKKLFKFATDTTPKMEVKDWRLFFFRRQGVYNGFCVVVQAKTKTVLKLVSTFGSPKAVDYEQRRRKPTISTVPIRYTIKAPEAQMLYNKHKGAVDQFNRFRLQYFRMGRDNNDAVKYVRFFLSAWMVNAYLHFLACNPINEDGDEQDEAAHSAPPMSQLEYRVAAIDWLLELIGLGPEPVPQSSPIHWPEQRTIKRNCTHKEAGRACSNKSYTWCQACGAQVQLCGKHLDDYHANLRGLE